MPSLAEFVRARLTEDEAVAQAATDGPWSLTVDQWNRHPYVTSPAGWVLYGEAEFAADQWLGADAADLAHVIRWDPARVLAECQAKRRLLEHVEPDPITRHPGDDYALRLLALPYAGHPDYQPGWAP